MKLRGDLMVAYSLLTMGIGREVTDLYLVM